MNVQIKGLVNYQKEFDADKRKCAYKHAMEVRQFEIELYWKRATYFWTLLAATFAGYFALASSDKSVAHPGLLFLVSCIGLVLSTSWYLVNRGSKYWQENWERHVDFLEDEFAGPLYKTTISKQLFYFFKFWEGYPFSVSKVNQLASLFVVLVWASLAVSSFPPLHQLSSFPLLQRWVRLMPNKSFVLAAITFTFLIFLVCLGKAGSKDKRRQIDFYKRELD